MLKQINIYLAPDEIEKVFAQANIDKFKVNNDIFNI